MRNLIKAVCILLFPLIIGCLFLQACRKKKNTFLPLLRRALQQVGKIRVEWEKILFHYENSLTDNLKYKVAFNK